MMKGFKIANVDFSYNSDNIIFEGLSVQVGLDQLQNGYTVAVMGKSGSGKSTLLKLFLLLKMPITSKGLKIIRNFLMKTCLAK